MSVGFIKIHRAMFDNWVSDEPDSLAVWVRILSEANFKTTKKRFNGSFIEVKRGQLIFGLNAFSDRSGVSVMKLRRIIADLESDGMINRQKTNRYSLITVLSYDEYQGLTSQEQANNNPTTSQEQANNNPTTGQEQSNNNQITTLEEVKKEKNDKKVNKYSPDDLKAADWIYSKLLIVNPEHKKPNMDSWANTIRLMRERDNRTHEDICKVFAWANNDSFWSANILSPSKLREKFDQLLIKVNQPAVVQQAKPRFSDGDGQLPNQPQDNDFIEHEQGYITYER